jgi:hypothetical protein
MPCTENQGFFTFLFGLGFVLPSILVFLNLTFPSVAFSITSESLLPGTHISLAIWDIVDRAYPISFEKSTTDFLFENKYSFKCICEPLFVKFAYFDYRTSCNFDQDDNFVHFYVADKFAHVLYFDHQSKSLAGASMIV